MMNIRGALLALGVTLAFAAAPPAHAATKSPAMQACSDQWAQLKADDKVPSGQTWPKFWSQCAKDYAAAHPDEVTAADKTAAAPEEPAPKAKAKPAAKAEAVKTEPAKKEPVKKAASAAADAKGKSPAMQACSDQWAQLKADDKVPSGQTWPKFWSQCAKDYAAAHPDEAAAVKAAAAPEEPAPAAKSKAAAKTTAADKTTAAAKPAAAKPAPAKSGQTAMQACSDDWAKLKADDKVPAGQTWPKFWSQCAKDYAAANPADDAMPAKAAKAEPAPAAPAKSGQTAMQACSDDWAKLKADDKVPAGQTWPKFWSQCAKDYAAANPADDAKPAKAAKAEPAPAAPAKSGQTAMQACSDDWAKLKADDKVPAGQTWPKFWSQCAKDYAAANAGAAAPATAAKSKAAKADDDEEIGGPLPEPEVAATIDPDKPAAAGKREPTPGQKAAWGRMRACGAEWQAAKKAERLPAGAKWPQYWSDCNKRLKAKG